MTLVSAVENEIANNDAINREDKPAIRQHVAAAFASNKEQNTVLSNSEKQVLRKSQDDQCIAILVYYR